MAIRRNGLLGLVTCVLLSGSAQAASLSPEGAVRLFLGVQARSPVTVEAVEAAGDAVTVKGLSAPLGEGPDAPRLHVDLVQVTGIVTNETTATFGSILGSGVSIEGQAALKARSLMMTDVAVKDLGVKPLSIAAVDNLMLGDLVIADQARVESYSVGMTGPLTGVFSGTVKIQGIQTAIAPLSGDRFDLALKFTGDGARHVFDATYSIGQSLLGVIDGEAHWSDVTFRSGSTSPLSQFDLVASLRDAKLVSGTVALHPGPNGRMLLRALSQTQRDDLAAMGRKFIERDGSVPAAASAAIGSTLLAFLNRPELLRVAVRPREPVALTGLGSETTIQAVIDRLGMQLSQGD